jgi:hypothetical protein
MSRGRKLTKAEKRQRRERRERRDGEQHQDSDFDDFVQDTAARFTCSTETAADFAFHCQSRGTDLDVDLALARLAQEIWQDKSQASLVAALADLASEEQRHRDALVALGQRFDALANEQNHQHLDPPEDYRLLIRQRILSEQPDTA